ncbi:RmlC-like cupin domain-containing protein [Boeremia exigua]|uniref:RmlC-like cupin domain-containing protein n=1 Tax=Boeremia exigua TaxID=749465 RepID=UPI001E8D1B41|nr:RmlC-like cupin domain-containing protein [Boeremia exigua]KAH6633172.1 RmlC-like cupin domain-containing protein [Boeremia exigua]
MPGRTAEPTNRFEALVQSLSDRLGPCSGINSDDVDEDELQQLMADYVSDESEWEKYSMAQPGTAYTRNLVDKGNGKCNLLLLVWAPNRGSPIHDHANAHCIMKILKGSLTETRYAWPTIDLNNSEDRHMQLISDKTYQTDQVTYMSDKLGLHRIANPDKDNYAVSLHLYTPPNAAVYGCNVFNEANGHSTHMAKCTVFSEYGVPCMRAVRS